MVAMVDQPPPVICQALQLCPTLALLHACIPPHLHSPPLCSQGEEVLLYDGRPNGELLLATGAIEAGNPAGRLGSICMQPREQRHASLQALHSKIKVSSKLHKHAPHHHHRSLHFFASCCADCLFMEASLVAADRLYTTKRQVLENLDMGASCCRPAPCACDWDLE